MLVVFIPSTMGPPPGSGGRSSEALALIALPVSVGIAILKYRLYDIDVVINRTVVYVTLAAFITLVYVAIVVVLGGLIGAANESLGLSIVATAIVAVAFQPVRERVQHFANRFVYGERATPYEVLARFSERVAGTYATEDVLPRTARVIAEGTGAERAEVWLRIGEELVLGAAWPIDGIDRRVVSLAPGASLELDGADRDRPGPVPRGAARARSRWRSRPARRVSGGGQAPAGPLQPSRGRAVERSTDRRPRSAA